MGKFRTIKDIYRAYFKPGVRQDFNPFGANQGAEPLATATQNSNMSPNVDNIGNQWIRDASKPVYFNDESNLFSEKLGYPWKQYWTTGLGVSALPVGIENGLGQPLACYKVAAEFGDPTIPWETAPYWVQLHFPINLVVPNPGAIPKISFPCPRPNVGQGRFEMDFGVDTPVNCVSGNTGGLCVALSSTPDTYTAPGGPLGRITVNWAFYNYQV